MAVARTCGNCAFVKAHEISFNGGKTVHSISYSCEWGSRTKPKKVPWWVERYHTVVPEAPKRKRGCAAFQANFSAQEVNE